MRSANCRVARLPFALHGNLKLQILRNAGAVKLGPLCLVVVFSAMNIGLSHAATVTLAPTVDTFIHNENATVRAQAHDGLGLSVTKTFIAGTPNVVHRRNLYLQFDLSSVTQEITGAVLELYQSGGDAVPMRGWFTYNTASPLPPITSSITWDAASSGGYFTAELPTQAGLGSYSGATTSGTISTTASAFDLSLLNTVRTSALTNGKIFLLGIDLNSPNTNGTPFGRLFQDIESSLNVSGSHAPRLILTVIPEPGSFGLAGIAFATIGWWRAKRRNTM